jgi:Fe-S cluster biosynthesis and repair protein YggX
MADDDKDDPSCAPKPAEPPPPAPGARVVQCVKFGRPMEGLQKPPLKGEIGQKVFDNVSKEAWRMWLEHSKMLVNEFRLDLMSEQGQKIWFSELEKYFWGEGSQLPPDFVPQKHK